jgi:diacylglycerol kinase (ATP)
VPRRVAILVNPTAGRGKAALTADRVFSSLLTAGVAVDLVRGADADDARERLDQVLAAGPDTVVVVGGDGLVHLAVQAVAGTPVALAIVPSGTGNDIARAFGITGDPDLVVAAILTGSPVPTDLVRVTSAGTVASRWYLGVACSGFDSRINARANRMRRPRGPSKYTIALLAEIRDIVPLPLTVTVDGVAETRPSLLVAVGNTAYYGGGMAICVGADPADGLLDVIHVEAMRRDRVLRLFPRLFSGSHLSLPYVHRRQGRVVTIEIPAEADGSGSPGGTAPVYAVPPVYADGEDAAALPVTLTCEPGALPVYR